MLAQPLGQQQAVRIMPLHPLRKAAGLRIQHRGILAPQQFLVLRADDGLELAVERRLADCR